MSTPWLEYKARKAKITFNYFIAGFLILLGGVLSLGLSDDPSQPLVWVGALTFLGGVSFLIYTRRHNVGRQVNLYMDRVEMISRDKTRTWKFDDIDEIHVLHSAFDPSGHHPSRLIMKYHFLINGRVAFAVGPIYVDWEDLGEKITKEVIKRLSRRYPDEIKQGEGVAFFGRVRYRPIAGLEAFW